MQKCVVYLRVSTQRQGASGLGIDAQRYAVAQHVARIGGDVTAEYVEVESGKRADRPQLESALKQCRLTGALLVVAKLDRLARNVSFIAKLMDGGVDFVACDLPQASRLTLHIMAAMAEHEREQISQRTKAALQAAKRKGVKLGGVRPGSGWRGQHQKAGAKANEVRAAAYAGTLQEILQDIGPLSLPQTAAELARRGIRTPRGGTWTPTAVRRVKLRLAVT